MADLGSDFHCVTDIDFNLSAVSGRTCLAEAIARRLQTPRGGLWYDADYGTDLRQFINSPALNLRAVSAAAYAEILKDERVESAQVTTTMPGGPSATTLTVTVSLADSAGPFTLVLSVSSLTVSLLNFSEG